MAMAINEFMVRRFWWNITNDPDVMSIKSPKPHAIRVYTIGLPNVGNLFYSNLAFKAKDITEIYDSSVRNLPQDWEGLYFCKAVAELITYLNTDVITRLFDLTEARGVDIVHIHGAF